MKRIIAAIALGLVPLVTLGAGGVPPMSVKTDITNQKSLQSGAKVFVNYCMGCHTITTMVYPVKSHYLLDKVLWALGDDLVSSIYVPKAIQEKAVIKFKSPATYRLQMI